MPEALVALENVGAAAASWHRCLEVREAMGMLAVENLIAFAEGREPPNC